MMLETWQVLAIGTVLGVAVIFGLSWAIVNIDGFLYWPVGPSEIKKGHDNDC